VRREVWFATARVEGIPRWHFVVIRQGDSCGSNRLKKKKKSQKRTDQREPEEGSGTQKGRLRGRTVGSWRKKGS